MGRPPPPPDLPLVDASALVPLEIEGLEVPLVNFFIVVDGSIDGKV
jgi:hypothetical protein